MTTTHKGKRAEFLVFSELLRKEADVYVPLADIGIDAIIRKQDGKIIEIQVKSTEQGEDEQCFQIAKSKIKTKTNRYIILVDMSEGENKEDVEFWILPAKEYIAHSTGTEYLKLDLDAAPNHGKRLRRDLLKKYKNAWEDLLE